MMRPTILLLLASILLGAPAGVSQKPSLDSPAVVCEVPALPYSTGEMQAYFKTYNLIYWAGKLPATVVVWTALGSDKYAETDKLSDGRFLIRLDVIRNKERNVAKTTLLHEMAHVKTWKEIPVHGPRWLAELHRIMLEGAFDDLV